MKPRGPARLHVRVISMIIVRLVRVRTLILVILTEILSMSDETGHIILDVMTIIVVTTIGWFMGELLTSLL